MKHVVVGTAGHIDHGKSALVRALTGTDPDRLEEEKRRGITIDLGFAHLDLGADLQVAFVDVPGHERFVKNMLAGAGGIDLVLLVVAADESVKPQTREHFDICRLLGIQKGLVALTKTDLVDPEMVELVTLEVREMTAGSFLESAPLVAVSSKTGEGLERLKAELRRLCLEIIAKPTDKPFRLPIDRVFVMKGFGTVVTGTLIAGALTREDEAEAYPVGRRVRVRGVEVHNARAERAVAGQRTALNLAGIEAKEIERGMVLAPPGAFRATARLDCSLWLLPTARPLKHRAKIHFHSGTAESPAEVVLISEKQLNPGERSYAQMRLERMGLFLPGDRFIIRQFSPVVTIGGGVVLDSLAPRHRLGDPTVRPFLEAIEKADDISRLELLTQNSTDTSHSALAARLGWSPAEVARLAQQLAARGAVKMLGQPPVATIHISEFERIAGRVLEELEKFHAREPLASGIFREDLRNRSLVEPRMEDSTAALVFNAVLSNLADQGKVAIQGESVSLKGREVRLSSEEAAAKEEIARRFELAGLEAPDIPDVVAKARLDPERAEKLLRMLVKERTLVKITEGLILHQRALDQLRSQLAEKKAKGNRLSVPEFKNLTGLSRKYAIPLLEYLDRARVTRREGDERIIL
jgi:selenocysteine-specific elongation factor